MIDESTPEQFTGRFGCFKSSRSLVKLPVYVISAGRFFVDIALNGLFRLDFVLHSPQSSTDGGCQGQIRVGASRRDVVFDPLGLGTSRNATQRTSSIVDAQNPGIRRVKELTVGAIIANSSGINFY